MSDAFIRASLIRLAHSRPDLRSHLLPLVTDRVAEKHGPGSVWKTEGGNWRSKNDKGEAKSFGDDQAAAKAHAGKGEGGKAERKFDTGKKPKSVYSKKHKVHLRGITDEQLDAFYDSPAGKEIKGYNLEVIAGSDGVVDSDSIERAVKVREKHLAIQRAKKKKKEDPDSLTDEDKANLKTDVCKATPACDGNLGVARSSMPQFLQVSPKAAIEGIPDKRYRELIDGEKAGKGLPSGISDKEVEAYYNRKNAEAAIEAGADPKSDVSVFDDWVKGLKKGGIKVTRPKGGMRVGDLKATQREISADAVLKNADRYLSGEDLTGGVIYVSSDGHILDGHHRWAGLLTADPDAKIPVVKIGVPMAELLEKSFDHPGVFRQDFRFQTVSPDEPLDLARKSGSTWKQRNGKWYGKNKDGDTGGPFASEDAAKDYASGKSKGKAASSRWTAYRKRSTSIRGVSSMTSINLRNMLSFAKSYAKLGQAVQEQLDDLLEQGIYADLNLNAVRMMKYELESMPAELERKIDEYLADHGEGMSGGRYASSNDTALRNRLIRLAHSRPDLRPHILPLVSDRAACGWGGGEAPVTARFEEGVSADPTENMSPEDAAEWKKQNAIHRDKFTKGAAGIGRTAGGRVYVTDNAIRESFGNGVEDVLLVVDRGAKKPFAAALQVLKTHRAELEQMDDIYKIKRFVDGKVLALTGKTPQWHSYSMPD